MATLPGLPMFGHGQIEGFTEKYGMEYQRPRYDETLDHWLVERHEREIAPLLQRRSLFAESSNFLLYDFFEASGLVEENVFAYSNRNGGERALVSTTTVTAPRTARSIFPRRTPTRAQANSGSSVCGRPRAERRFRRHSGIPRLAHRAELPAAGLRFERRRPHARSSCLPVPRVSRLA